MATVTERTACGLDVAYDADLGMAYPLTPCCQASGKGADVGVVCRNCYQPVGLLFGDCAMVATAPAQWDRVRDWLRATGCPCADACVEHTRYLLTDGREEGK